MEPLYMLVSKSHAEIKHGITDEYEWSKLHLISHLKEECDHEHYTADLKTPV